MKYKLIDASNESINKLIDYKLHSIIDYQEDDDINEKEKVIKYVNSYIPSHLDEYKLINVNNINIGTLSTRKYEDGILIDELFIDNKYRNKGLGTTILTDIIKNNKIVYLWVYKNNINAIRLYKKIGFIIEDETINRLKMKSI